jgi:iron complex outermembrane receptor protein
LFSQKEEPVQKSIDSFYLLSPVEVRSIRVSELAPFTKTNLSKQELGKQNLGQDIPFVLNQTPSVVVNSDAGNGIGYTGVRIRGTDATRINITLNGIPYNDAESQGSFFVDLPDLVSSTGSIQIQRGIGTSSNGAGAFGASINFSTNEINKKAYAEFNNSYGSFNSWKNTVRAGTGLLNEHFTADLRLSRISSDGYIDRAHSDLKSFYFSTAYQAKSNSLRLTILSGKEKTYQAWYGISEADLEAGNRRINYAGTEKPGEPYDNETDNYWQDHYQLFFDQQINKRFSFNTALFYTKGKGFYEQYKADQPYTDYGFTLPGNSDFIRQLWLDNDFYGDIFSLQYKNNKTEAILGGGLTRYNGNHFGELIWASKGIPSPTHRWYQLDALKTDFNVFLKEQTQFARNWYYFYDLQYHKVNYTIHGFRSNPSLDVINKYNFFNPKLGLTYLRNGWKFYLSFAVANKEPNRDDFETGNSQKPKPERLYDFEYGVERKKGDYSWSANFFYMKYKDQLVLTGMINDVGAYTRTNIPKSYRAGIELAGNIKMNRWLALTANLALSQNKVLDFTEYIDDYDNGGQIINHFSKTDIAFSPSLVGAGSINIFPCKNFEVDLLSKYVSRQYLDNTSNSGRKLNGFFVQDLQFFYIFKTKTFLKESNISFHVNNLLNKHYEPNGYTYNYFYGGELSVNNYYFPMAGTNFMLGLNIKL